MDLFDLHCDTITECSKLNCGLRQNNLHISIDKADYLSKWCQVFAIWIPNEYRGVEACNYFDRVYKYFLEQMEKNRDKISFCKSSRDISLALNENKSVAILSVEGGAAAAGSLERLQYMYECGVRILTLTWNGECEIACGSDVNNGGGLTKFGFDAVRKMEELGITVDVSHINDRGFYDVAEISTKPFIASHSNSRNVFAHHRNLTDEQFKIVKDKGGVVGLNLYTEFLPKNVKSGCEGVLKNLYHFLELGGENTVALGADFDGAEMFDDLNGIDKISYLYEYLIRNGITESTVKKVFFENTMSLFDKVL